MQVSDVLIHNTGLIRKIAVICKDSYTINTIDDLFIFAGAQEAWRVDFQEQVGSMRMQHVNEWVEGLKQRTDDVRASEIIRNVVMQILDECNLDEPSRKFLERAIAGSKQWSDVEIKSTEIAPNDIDILLEHVIGGLPRAIYPLKNRRKGRPSVEFNSEYDVQDLFNALIQPWIGDIRTEEYTPSYAGSSSRMDFLLYDHKIVCELKYVRDASHGRRVGDELTIDVAHYRKHPDCNKLVAVIYDPNGLISNPDGLKSDIESDSQGLEVNVFIVPPRTLA